MHLRIFPHNYISTLTLLDLDAMQHSLPFGVSTLFGAVLSGKTQVWIDYRFHIQGGVYTFSIEKAYYGDKSLSLALVRKLIQTMAAMQPERFDTERPIPLPFWTARDPDRPRDRGRQELTLRHYFRAARAGRDILLFPSRLFLLCGKVTSRSYCRT